MTKATDTWMTHDDFYSTTITTTIPAGGDTIAIDPQLNFNSDKTPKDPFEEAELKLAGICPSCRNTNGEHEWDCKHYDYSTTSITGAGITFNSNYQPGFSINTDNEVSVGQATLTEAKIKKLDKLLDLFDDEELEDLILAKQMKKVDSEKK
jgi:hypothetical protein